MCNGAKHYSKLDAASNYFRFELGCFRGDKQKMSIPHLLEFVVEEVVPPVRLGAVRGGRATGSMGIVPKFTNQRRVLQLGLYGLRHGPRVFEKLNPTNIFLAKQFHDVRIACNVCGERSKVWYEMHSVKEKTEHRVGLLRETLECLNCLSRMRYRIMAHGLLAEYRRRGEAATSVAALKNSEVHLDILDTDAFSPAARMMKGNEGFKLSSYTPDRPFGSVDERGVHNIDLQAMSFPDGSLDVILSSDVMEHVRDFDRANAEIFRCLKPGGVHIFTVPFHEPKPLTRTLIDTSSPVDIYLEPAQMHGDDNLTKGVPAYRIYGLDLLDDLRRLGFEADLVRIKANDNGIFDGCYFTARRPLEGAGEAAPHRPSGAGTIG